MSRDDACGALTRDPRRRYTRNNRLILTMKARLLRPGKVRVSVTDNGVGLQEDRADIQPFKTTTVRCCPRAAPVERVS